MINEDFDVLKSFDEISGPDILSLDLDNFTYFGYIDKSPIEERLCKSFNYQQIHNIYNKPYKVHWIIIESKLMLGYANGIINGVRLYTNDIFPELHEDIGLAFFHYFSGQIILYPKVIEKSEIEITSYKIEKIFLDFQNGVLVKTEYLKL